MRVSLGGCGMRWGGGGGESAPSCGQPPSMPSSCGSFGVAIPSWPSATAPPDGKVSLLASAEMAPAVARCYRLAITTRPNTCCTWARCPAATMCPPSLLASCWPVADSTVFGLRYAPIAEARGTTNESRAGHIGTSTPSPSHGGLWKGIGKLVASLQVWHTLQVRPSLVDRCLREHVAFGASAAWLHRRPPACGRR